MGRSTRGRIAAGLMGVLAAGAATVAAEQELGWPREVQHPEARIVVYQPQFDELTGMTAKGRSAVSVAPLEGKKQPVFGAVWFEARVDVDREARTADFLDIRVTRVRFPDARPEQEAKLAALLEEAADRWDNRMSYDRFLAAAAALESAQGLSQELRNDPPAILVEQEPAMLLLFDGKPRLADVEGSGLRRVINTPSVVVFDNAAARYYLYGGESWFEAPDPLGPWTAGAEPTAEVRTLGERISEQAAQAAAREGQPLPQDDEKELAAMAADERAEAAPPRTPKVIAVTDPTELIVFDGEPQYKPLAGGEVLYVTNTGSDVLLEVASQQHYVLLSGRWFRSSSFEGPWEFVRPDQLPASFAKIPEDSAKGVLLAQVPGTPQAEEALADAQLPQVAAVRRGSAQLDLRYDGEPQFEAIPGTTIEYAKNVDAQVLRIDGRYYACKDAVWYVSSAATGPWEVADEVPAEVQKIPPESPAYNVKYVYVYDSTPEVVYVGYTPAYLGCYPYYGTVVWGTGYPYSPWIGSWYYPRPWTWGFHAHYNPWTGWSFGVNVGWSWGWGSITIGWGNWGWGGYRPPYWGPGGYYPVYRPPYYPPHRPPYHPGRPIPTPYGGTREASSGTREAGAGSRDAGRPANLYERPANQDRVASTRERPRPELPTQSAGGRAKNNVYADREGNVYRRKDNGSWQQRSGDKWKPTPPPAVGGGDRTRPSTPSARSAPRPAPYSGLERDYRSRQRGSTMSRGYGGGGGARSMPRGGGRRR